MVDIVVVCLGEDGGQCGGVLGVDGGQCDGVFM